MEHLTATTAREAFAALATGDIELAFARMHDDFLILNDIGAGPWREVRGKDGVLEFWTQWMELFDGSFRQDVTDVIGYDDRVLLVIHETGTAQRQEFDNRATYLLELRDDKWAVLRTMDMDHEKIHRFWDAVTVPEAVPASR